MFCPNCGTEIKEKKTFCPKCGSPLGVEAVQEDTKTVEAAASTENVHENVIPPQGAPVPSKKGGKKKFIIGGIVAVVLILIAVMIGTSGGNTGTTSTDTYIETVQNGYLGEFTDMTVQELLSSYYEDLLGCTAEWDGGENDDGQQIVEVKYTDETVGDTTIQFKMLDEQVFKISAFVDPTFRQS